MTSRGLSTSEELWLLQLPTSRRLLTPRKRAQPSGRVGSAAPGKAAENLSGIRYSPPIAMRRLGRCAAATQSRSTGCATLSRSKPPRGERHRSGALSRSWIATPKLEQRGQRRASPETAPCSRRIGPLRDRSRQRVHCGTLTNERLQMIQFPPDGG